MDVANLGPFCYIGGVKMLLAALVLVSVSFGAETNKATVQTNSVAVALKNRRAVLDAQLKQVGERKRVLVAQDNAQMRAHSLRTGKMGTPRNTQAIRALVAQEQQLSAALIDLDLAEGKVDRYLPKTTKR